MRRSSILLALVLLVGMPALLSAGDSLKPEEIVARHLDSIGTAAVREAVKSRVVQGNVTYRIVVSIGGGGGQTEGKTGLVSEGHKLRFKMKFTQTDYVGENFVFNGDAVGVAFATATKSRSPFGSFVATQDVILRDGLLGGVLTTAWPLLDMADRKAKLTLEGVKKIDGRPAYQMRYQPHKRSEAQIMLYFDQETFHHVKTEYSTSVANNVGADITQSSKLMPERTTLEETFADFRTADGLTLPGRWTIHFTRELPDGSTSISAWELKEDEVTNNMGLDPRNFEVK